MTWHHASPNYLLYMSINYPRVTHNVDNPEIQWGIALMDEQACPVATGAASPNLVKNRHTAVSVALCSGCRCAVFLVGVKSLGLR